MESKHVGEKVEGTDTGSVGERDRGFLFAPGATPAHRL